MDYYPTFAQQRLMQQSRIAEAEKHAFGAFRGLFRCLGEAPVGLRGQLPRLGGRVRPQRDLMTGAQEVACHGVAHQPEAEKSEFCH
jgi:hypothetical protein